MGAEIRSNVPLAPHTWFGVGGSADRLARVRSEADLAELIAATDPDEPVHVLGRGSNLLVRDGGVRGLVVKLEGAFADVRVDGRFITAGAGALDAQAAKAAQHAGLAGLEFFVGVPGAIGGALRMNAGAYGAETKDRFRKARIMTRTGAVIEVDLGAMGFSYRRSGAPDDLIFLSAVFEGEPGEPADIAARMAEIKAARAQAQPQGVRTGGSTFKNPDPEASKGRKAWELIDAAGCRGLTRGGAQVSEKHCNFLINLGAATAADLEGLGEDVRARVFDKTGVALEWEIRRWGEPLKEPAEA